MGKQRCGGRKPGDGGAKNGAAGRRRSNRAGTLEKRGNKWRARWTSYTPEGKPVRMTKTLAATNIADARKELDALTGEAGLMSAANDLARIQTRLGGIRAEMQKIEDAKPALALADMFEAFERSPHRPQKSGSDTMRQYRLQIGRFVSWMEAQHPEALEMRQVSKDIANEFLADFGGKVSPNTYNKYVALLALVWKVLGESARCMLNPWDGVQRKALPKTNGRRALTVEELTRVTADLTGEMRILFALGIYTGLRLADCALMDWGKIDLARRVIVTIPRKTAKTGTAVEIPIHPVLAGMLADIPPESRNGYLLPETAEAYLHDSARITDKVQRIFNSAGIKTRKEVDGYAKAVAEVGFHSLRHSFVSLMGNRGAPLALVQSIVGHSNPMMTAHYFHARTDALANAVNALPAVMGETIDAEASTSPADGETAAGATATAAGAKARMQALDAALDAIRKHGDKAEIKAAAARLRRLVGARRCAK